jgi:hypothetical protein
MLHRFGRSVLGAFFVLIILVSMNGSARAQYTLGPFTITGLYQYTINSNDGHRNPNNEVLVPSLADAGIVGRPSGLYAEEGNPMFNYMGQFLQLRIAGRFGPNWSVYMEPRVWNDLTKAVDDHYDSYESVPLNWKGNGYFLGGGGNDLKAAMWQGFVDYRSGPLWIRVGKQSIAWSEAIAQLVLDQVDSLELSDYFFFSRAFEEFDYQRIPELGVRIAYTIPNEFMPDLTWDTFVSPGTWTPDIIPAQGSAYSTVPGVVFYKERVEQGKPILATQLSGTLGGMGWTLNVLTRPESFPIPITVPLTVRDLESPVNRGGFVLDKRTGIPIVIAHHPPPFGPGDFALKRVFTWGRHPRYWLFGGSANYPFDSLGAIGRIEAVVVPDHGVALLKPFTFPTGPHTTQTIDVPGRLVKRPQLNSMIAFDRPTYWYPGFQSLFISFQTEFIYNMGGIQHLQSIPPTTGADVDSFICNPSVFLQQPFLNARLNVEFLYVGDTAGGAWLQPGFHYEHRQNYAFDVYYNSFSGEKTSRFPAQFGRQGDEGAWARFTYKF